MVRYRQKLSKEKDIYMITAYVFFSRLTTS